MMGTIGGSVRRRQLVTAQKRHRYLRVTKIIRSSHALPKADGEEEYRNRRPDDHGTLRLDCSDLVQRGPPVQLIRRTATHDAIPSMSPRNWRLLVGLMSYPFRYRLKVFKALTQSRAPIFFPSSRLRGK